MVCQMMQRSETMNFSRILGVYADDTVSGEPGVLDSEVRIGGDRRFAIIRPKDPALKATWEYLQSVADGGV